MILDHKMLIPSFYPKQLKELLNYFEIDGVVIKNRDGHGIRTEDVIEMNNEQFVKLKLKFEIYSNDDFETLRKKWHGKNIRVVSQN